MIGVTFDKRCPWCGKALVQTPKRKARRYCCESHRVSMITEQNRVERTLDNKTPLEKLETALLEVRRQEYALERARLVVRAILNDYALNGTKEALAIVDKVDAGV